MWTLTSHIPECTAPVVNSTIKRLYLWGHLILGVKLPPLPHTHIYTHTLTLTTEHWNVSIYALSVSAGRNGTCYTLPAAGDGIRPEGRIQDTGADQLQQAGNRNIYSTFPGTGPRQQGLHHHQWSEGVLQGMCHSLGKRTVNACRPTHKDKIPVISDQLSIEHRL